MIVRTAFISSIKEYRHGYDDDDESLEKITTVIPTTRATITSFPLTETLNSPLKLLIIVKMLRIQQKKWPSLQ